MKIFSDSGDEVKCGEKNKNKDGFLANLINPTAPLTTPLAKTAILAVFESLAG